MDIPVRYGGDEFAVILPYTDIPAAYQIAERIRLRLVNDARTSRYQVTGSFGMASYDRFGRDDAGTLIERADQAMYLAKKDGGNQVKCLEVEPVKAVVTEVTRSEKDQLFSLFPGK